MTIHIVNASRPGEEQEIIELTEDKIIELEQQRQLAAEQIAANKWIEERQLAYPSHAELIVAMWESIVEGRNSGIEELQAMREQVKLLIPKPEGV